MKITLAKIAEYSKGILYGDGSVEIDGFFTDSRKAEPTKMFVPIKGERVDAHKFIPQVAESGCKATFSEEKLSDDIGINYVLVKDSRDALQLTAKGYRETLKIPVIGITGSVGKTSTKEVVALALESQINIMKTEGNANSQVGLPQMVMKIEPEHEAAVLELGMSMPGEMEKIVRCAKPTTAVITNIGVSHIEFHGTKENIMREKLHIADYIPTTGTIFVNGDDELLASLKDEHKSGKLQPVVLTFGTKRDCDFKATYIEEHGNETHFTYDAGKKNYSVVIPAIGMHHVMNALAALAVTEYLGLDVKKAINALATFTAARGRGEVLKYGDITVIDDTYNASPDSMIASVDVLARMSGRKIAVLSDMLELGDYAEKGHREVGESAKKKGIDFLIAVGEDAKYIYDGFDDKKNSRYYKTNAEACAYLDAYLKDGDVVLVKGSRGMHTEEVVCFIEHLDR